MKHIHSILAIVAAGFASIVGSQAQEEAPVIPIGTLSAFPTIVQTGTKPTLTWDITLPESVEDLVDIEGPGTIVPNRDLIMEVRILGAGVTVKSNSKKGFDFVPTQVSCNYNGGGYTEIFWGTNEGVDPVEVVYTQTVTEGANIDFGSRYHYNDSWGTWYSSTNSNQVVALQNGDIPPTTTPMHQAPTIEEFVAPYLDEEGKVKIGPRDVLYLMEITHTDPTHGGYDLQDMAILVTFYDEVSESLVDSVDSGSTSEGKNNNGHGNNDDGVDSSNPGKAPKTDINTDANGEYYDDEKKKRGRRKK